jgi:hypothetical protein
MKKNEIKKALYKQKPKARLLFIRKGSAFYTARLKDGETEESRVTVYFEVPVSDMGDAEFYDEMDAKLLNRWIVDEEKV